LRNRRIFAKSIGSYRVLNVFFSIGRHRERE
jgi:hypothetical protein